VVPVAGGRPTPTGPPGTGDPSAPGAQSFPDPSSLPDPSPGVATLHQWTLWDLAAARAALGDKPLLVVGDDVLTYSGLYESAGRLATGLVALGVEPGDRVATFGANCTDWVVAWFACAAVGAVWVPLNASLVGADLAYALGDCRPALLVVDAGLVDRLAAVGDALPGHVAVREGDGGDARSGDGRVRVPGGAGVPGAFPFADLCAGPAVARPTPARPGDPVAVIYTGGSTGMPKGVVVSHTYYVASGIRYAEIGRTTAADVHYSGSHQLYHSGGQQLAVVGPMVSGMTSHLARWFSASRYWAQAREAGATVVDPIGPVIAALVRQPAAASDREHRVRVGVGAATGQIPPATREEFERRFGVPLLEVYSQTETGGVLLCSERLHDRRPGTAGRPGGWATIGIVDDDDLLLPPGELGEIVVRPTVANTFMVGYLGKPEQTAASWRNLWHHTGDLGSIDEDGYLSFVGRQAHWIRRRGENVSCHEVEARLAAVEGVAECAVVGVPDQELGDEELKAYVVPEPGSGLTEAQVVAACVNDLAYFKVPRYVELVAELPRTAAKGEVERHRLRERGIGRCYDARATPPPGPAGRG
jgi:crotonobetaine/carnitine-CoA ligase